MRGTLPLADPRNADSRLGAEQAIEALHEYVVASSVAAEQEAAEARAEGERQAAERRERAREFEQSGVPR